MDDGDAGTEEVKADLRKLVEEQLSSGLDQLRAAEVRVEELKKEFSGAKLGLMEKKSAEIREVREIVQAKFDAMLKFIG
jgi:hypothetical protein